MGLLLALVVVILFPSAGLSGTVTTTLTPTDDAYVLETSATTNFGTSTQLSAGTSPITRSYLKFSVPALSGTVGTATLRVFPTVSSATGFDVRSVANNWNEGNITYKNSPAPSTTITGSSGPLTAGTWASVDVTSLVTGNGTKSFVLTSTASPADLFGSRESANPPQLVVSVNDTTAPSVTLTAPGKNASLTTSLPTYSGKAGTAPNDSSTVNVNVYAGSSATGTPVQTLSATAQSGSYSVTATSPLPNGTYTAQASQQDAAGNTGTSSANTFRISDTTAPTVALAQPANGAALGTTTPSFSGTAGNAAGDSSTVTVKVYSGSSATGTPVQTLAATRQADNSYSVGAGAPLAPGTYTARAEQQDAAGNTGTSSANTFIVDTTAPTVTLSQPANGALVATATPSFAGTAGSASGDSATVTVKVYAGASASGTPVQTLSATRQANNSYAVSASTLADGTYTAQAAQSDSAGNSGLSSANTFTIDVTAPGVTLTQPANGATLSTALPTYSGVAGSASGDSPTVTVKVYAGSSASGTPAQTLSATRQADNSYSVAASVSLADGTYTAQASQTDAAGNTGSSSANTFTIGLPDTTPPSVSLTQPADGATLTSATPSFAGVAGSAPGDSATVTVNVYAGASASGTPLQSMSATRQADNTYSVSASPALADGVYTAQASQSDAAGNTGTSSPNTFTIDATAPVVSLTQPANGASVATAFPSFAGVAGSAGGDSSLVQVSIYAGSSASGTPVQSLSAARQADSSYSVLATVPLADGTYTAVARQQDAAGNTGSSSANTFTVDTTAPSPTLAQPADGATVATALPTFAGVAGSAVGDSANVTVRLYAGSSASGAPLQTLSATRQPDNSYSVSASSSLAEGTYTAQASQSDAAGNTGTSSAHTFTVSLPDTTPPTVSLTQPADGATLTTALPTYSGVAGNASGDSSTVTVKVYAGASATGTPVQSLSASRQADNSYLVTASSPLANGTYTARAEQQDAVGNTGFSSANSFTVSVPDTTPPSVSLTQPADGATLTSATPSFAGVAGNASGDSANVTVKVYAGANASGTPVQTLSASRQADNSYSVSASPALADGTYTARASQSDAAGNTGTSSANTFTIDTTGPAVTLTQPANGATLSTATPTFAGSAGAAGGDSNLVVVNVYAGASTSGTPVQTLSATRRPNNSYSVSASPALADGTYTAQASQQDAAGNTGSSSANTFTVDTTAPVVSLAQPANGASVPTALPSFAGVAGSAGGDSSVVQVSIYAGSSTTGTPVQSVSASRQSDNSYAVLATAPLADGTYTAVARQQDAAGNTGSSSANTFTVDTTAPTPTLAQPADGATVATALPSFTGVAGSASGDSSTVTVKVYAGSSASGTPVQTLSATRQANNSYSVSASASLAEGTYTAQTSQSDAAGNTGSSSAHTFTVSLPDTTPPSVSLTQPADGASLKTASPSFAGVAGSASGDSANVTVKVYAGASASGTPVQTLSATRQADNSYSVTASSPLANGTYTARAEQQDASGNTGFSSANTFTVSVPDTTPPSVSLAQPADGATLTTALPTYSGAAGSATGDSATVTVKVYAGSSASGTPLQTLSATRQADNSYSVLATTALADGTYTAQASQSDAAGNTGSSSANTFAVDTTGPAVTLTQPANGASVATAFPSFAGVAGSAGGDSSVVQVSIYAGSSASGTPVQSLSASRQSDNSYAVLATAPLADGTYTAVARQQDAAGNTGSSSANTFTVDTTAPSPTLAQPADGATVATALPSFTGVAGNASGDSSTVTVKVYAGSSASGSPVQTLSATRQPDSSYSVSASSSLAEGAYTAQASQSDAAGNTGSSSTHTFTIDTSAPSPTLTQPANGATISTATPSFAGVAANGAGDSATVTVKVYAGASASGTPVRTLSATRQPDNSYSVSASPALADGTYTAQASQQDSGNNTGFSSANTFTVDATAPSPTLNQPANGATVSTTTPSFAGVAGNAAGDSATVTVKVYAGASASGTPVRTLSATRQADNSYSVAASPALADGTYTARAEQQDAAGNTGASSANTFTVDTTGPAVTLTQPASGAVVANATPTFAGVAGSATGDAATVTVKLYAGSSASGTPLQTLSAARQPNNSYSVTATSHLNPGTYTARAQQQDAAGNTGSSSANTFTVKITVVSLTFNDGIASQYTYARPVLKAHNMNGTFYVPSGWISNLGGYMTWGQLDNLYRDGNEVGGMDTDHVSLTQVYNSDWTQDYAYKKQEVCGDHDRLAQLGYDPQSFAYPASASSYTFPDGSTVEGIVKSCGYLSGRKVGGLSTTGTAAEPVPPPDAYALRTAGLPSGAVTLASLQSAVTAAANQGGVLPIAFNAFCHQGDANYSTCIASGNQPIDDAVFSQFLDWLQNAGQPGGAPAGVDVRTIRQVMGAPPQPTLPARPTVVSLTFNDGIASQYTYARPVLKAHNMNGTFYVPSGWISNLGGYMSWGQLDNLYRDGNEVGGMDTDHVSLTQVYNSDWTQDYAYKKQEVCGDHDRLAQLGYDPRSFAYPASAYNYTFPDGSTVEGIVKSCGYSSGRRVGGLSTTGITAEPVPPTDAYGVRTAGLPSGAVTLASLQSAVTAAASQGGGWVPIALNGFCHQGDANYSTCISSGNQPIDDAVFSQFLDWLQNAGQPGGAPAGVQVQTVRKVMGAPAQPPLPQRPTVVSLTFDDGTVTQYTGARSILSSHGMHGTFFINSGKVGADSTYMTWPQVNDLYADGNEIGGHTSEHVNLTQVDSNEATREVCYDRNLLLNKGFAATDLAYPYGAKNASVESIAQSCGYNSARGTESVSGSCPPTCADLIPPRDPYATKVIGSTSSTDTAVSLENKVIGVEQNGGGWAQIVIHDVCNSCGAAAVSPTVLSAFLDWLQTQAPNGVSVQTVQQVIGGAVKPAVAGPNLPPAVGATNGLTNSSLEQDANGDGIPDCFDTDSWGTQTRTWTRTTDAHTGTYAERVDVSGYSTGADKLNVFQDLGYCAPTVVPGHRYTLTTWYKSTAPVDFVVESRNASWLYAFWAESSPVFPASSTWTLASWTTPTVPNGINGLTFGLSLAANGSMTVDDIGITDPNP